MHPSTHTSTHMHACTRTSTYMHTCTCTSTHTALRGACCGLKNRWQWQSTVTCPKQPPHTQHSTCCHTPLSEEEGLPSSHYCFFVFKRKVTKEPVSAIREFLCLSPHAMAALSPALDLPDLPGELSLLYSSPIQPICKMK